MIKNKRPKLKHFAKNKIQKRLMVVAIQKDLDMEELKSDIMEQLDISPKQLTFFLENNGNPPSLNQMILMSQILECKIEDLIELK